MNVQTKQWHGNGEKQNKRNPDQGATCNADSVFYHHSVVGVLQEEGIPLVSSPNLQILLWSVVPYGYNFHSVRKTLKSRGNFFQNLLSFLPYATVQSGRIEAPGNPITYILLEASSKLFSATPYQTILTYKDEQCFAPGFPGIRFPPIVPRHHPHIPMLQPIAESTPIR